MALCAKDRSVIDICDQLVLGHANLGLVADHRVHPLDDPGGAAHIVDLGRGFHRALPVHQTGCIKKLRRCQPLLQRQKGRGGKVVIVHLKANAPAGKPARGDQLGKL